MAYSKLQNKLGKFLTAKTRNIEILFYLYPHTLKIFASFLKAVGTSRPIFKLLGVTEVCRKKSVKL